MSKYPVTLQTPSGKYTFFCNDDEYILDRAEWLGLDLPHSCRTGSCSACASKIICGSVD